MLGWTDALRVRHRGGFSLLDMQKYAAAIGFESDGYSQMTLEDLPGYVPLIVPIRARGYDHFVIVRRVTGQGIEIWDPGYGNYLMKHAQFLRAWSGTGFQVRQQKRE